jgi:hypothetical protein
LILILNLIFVLVLVDRFRPRFRTRPPHLVPTSFHLPILSHRSLTPPRSRSQLQLNSIVILNPRPAAFFLHLTTDIYLFRSCSRPTTHFSHQCHITPAHTPTRSPDLREKFIKTESELFRWRFETDDAVEKQEWLKSLRFDWVTVSFTFLPIL